MFIIISVLLEFRNIHKRDPLYNKRKEDLESLQSIWENMSKSCEIHSEALNELFDLIFGEIVPICSIIGGVIAQEAIKAVSGKEVPINNVFLLNPLNYSGKEETVGAVLMKNVLN